MKRRLEGKTAVITGGSRGIGRSVATYFAEEGANLFICARDEASLEKTATELRHFGGKVFTYRADISDKKAVYEMIQSALKELEHIDILVNNAGYHKSARFIDYSLQDFDQIMKVNIYGSFHVLQAVLPHMIERKKGKIVNVASTAGKWGSRNQSAYNASKHAIIGLTRCIALEMAAYGININAICPYLVEETGLEETFLKGQAEIAGVSINELRNRIIAAVPLGKLCRPEDVATLAVYLASDESNYMTGQSLSLCGGYTMI